MNTRLPHIENWPEVAREANGSVAALAKNCGVTVRTLQRYFRKEKGKSPKKWLIEQRLLRANELIQSGSSVKEAAARLDYKHQSHLTNGFRKHWGYCPTDNTSYVRAQNP